MNGLAIIALTILGFWLITVQWGILAVGCAVLAWKLIDADRKGSADSMFAGMFFLFIVGIVLSMFGF